MYDLTTLQKEANSRYGFSAEKTLDIAQSLYEKKFITYPRTGSRYISEDVAEEIPALIGNMTRYPRFAEYAGRMDTASLSRRSVDNEKIADHHALLPTENLPSELDADHRIVYEMVAGRMLETFSGACVKENTSLTLQSAGHDFTARGSIMVETGWRAVLNEPVEEKEEDMTLLPDIVQGDELPVKGCGTEQKQTRPRPLHTESSLLAAMETAGRELSDEAEREAMKDAGIGTPATRAAIIETLFAREYVRREKKSLVPTDKGLAVYAVVRDKKIADVAMTGGWELALSKIATGEMDAPTFHRGIEVFASQIAKELLEARIDGAESDTACPRCGRPVVFYPKLAKCQNPDCGLTVWRTVARKELTDKQLAELLTKGKTGTIRGFVKNGGGTSSRPRSFSSHAILPGRERGTNGNNRYLCHWKRPVITRYACLIRIFSVVGASGGNPGRLSLPRLSTTTKNSYHARQATPYPHGGIVLLRTFVTILPQGQPPGTHRRR